MDEMAKKYADVLKKLHDPKMLEMLSDSDKKRLVEWTKNLKYEWSLHAREQQVPPPGRWNTWLILAGRGWGKSRVGAEITRMHVQELGYSAVGLIAPTASDARDTMIDGKGGSSLLEISPQKEGLQYFPTKRRLVWANGTIGNSYSAEEPERLRGPQHDFMWMDELASWRYLEQTWDMAAFGLRLGKNPRRVITTTPKPVPLVRDLARKAVPYEEMRDDLVEDVVVTRGATMDNAKNLAPQFLEELKKKYEGTRLGRQEIYAEILDDNPNALFNLMDIEESRVRVEGDHVKPKGDNRFSFVTPGPNRSGSISVAFKEIIISIDPSMSADITSDETGILVMALGNDDCIYVLDDGSGIYSPNDWARRALDLYTKWRADTIVAEVNQGGDLVENTIRTLEKEMGISRVDYKKVRASKGKISRAEPVGALVEQNRIRHVGDFPKLEDQLISFSPGYTRSPDRLDAYVWGAHHLILQREKVGFFIA